MVCGGDGATGFAGKDMLYPMRLLAINRAVPGLVAASAALEIGGLADTSTALAKH
jgi:S-adenosylmethionine synthetase